MPCRPLALALLALASSGLGKPPSLLAQDEDVASAERAVIDLLVQSYATTDWSDVDAHLAQDPDDVGNPNVMVIPISLANAYLLRYETGGDNGADFDRAASWLEWAAQRYPAWKERWLSPAVAQYLAVGALWLSAYDTPERHVRLEALWDAAATILEQEADARLSALLPYRTAPAAPGADPYDSSTCGNTRAEEDAWEAVLLAAAANFLPDHPNASQWDAKARELAYDAITRPSDPPDFYGVKTTTVPENFDLANHMRFPNPYYMAATLMLLRDGALAYRLMDRAIPPEFDHNVGGLFSRYRSFVDGGLQWTVPADPDGDATVFPLGYDADFDRALVLQKAAQGYLWRPVGEVASVAWGDGDGLWTAIQNGKVVLYYLMGSYFWLRPPSFPNAPEMPHSPNPEGGHARTVTLPAKPSRPPGRIVLR